MAINTKTIQLCLWRVLKLSIQICYNFLKKHPTPSFVSICIFFMYIFLPSIFYFLMYTLLVSALAFVVYRIFLITHYKGVENVKSNKNNDDNHSTVKNGDMGAEVYVSDHDQTTRRRKTTEKDKDHIKANTEVKNTVCSRGSNGDLSDKSSMVEENLKDVREVKVDSSSTSSKVDQCNEGSKVLSDVKLDTDIESSEDEDDAHENKNKVVEWTADDQKNLMNLGNSEIEKNIRLENLIARRKTRKLMSLKVRNTLMRRDNNDPNEPIASIMVQRNNLFLSNKSDSWNSPVPGSAPSVLLPMHHPFDSPYGANEEKSVHMDTIQQDWKADQQKNKMFCRHESFRVDDLSSREFMQDRQETSYQDFSIEQKAVEKSENVNGGNADDHDMQEGQVSERIYNLDDNQNEENISTMQTAQLLVESNDRSSTSSSSDENVPLSKSKKDELLRSLNSLAQKNEDIVRDDNDQENSFSYDTDASTFESTRNGNNFFYNDREVHHAPSNSLASDLQVEVSEIGSSRSTSSPNGDSLLQAEDMRKAMDPNNEEIGPVSSQLSKVDKVELQSREVREVNEQDIISRIKEKADTITTNVPEKVVEPDSVSLHSQPPPRNELSDSIQVANMDSKPQHPDASDSLDTNSSQNSTEQMVAHITHSNSEKSEEQLNPPLGRSIEEGNIIFDQNDKESDDKELKASSSNVANSVSVANV